MFDVDLDKLPDENFLNAREVLLKSLLYPDYAREEYLIRQQKQSGWSLNVFTIALKHAFDQLYLRFQSARVEEIEIIKKRGEEMDQYFDYDFYISEEIENKTFIKITFQEIWELKGYIDDISKSENPEQDFQSLHVIHFVESALSFIKEKFIDQAEVIPIIKGQVNNKESKSETNLIDFSIHPEASVLNFDKFRFAVRELLLNSINSDYLNRLLINIFNKGIEIIKLWNAKLYPFIRLLDLNGFYNNTPIYKKETYFFDHSKLRFIKISEDYKELQLNQLAANWTNIRLAQFSSVLTIFLKNEILNIKTKIPVLKTPPPEVVTFEMLFKPEYIHLIDDCIGLLKNTEPATINQDEEYIRNEKSVFVVWYNALQYIGIAEHLNIPDKGNVLSKVFKERFTNFTMDSSQWRKKPGNSALKFKYEFEDELKSIKLIKKL